MFKITSAAILACVLSSGVACAQAAATAPANPAPAAATTAGSTATGTDKQARSKQCSAEADQKGLHGKARKAFRSKCKSGKA